MSAEFLERRNRTLLSSCRGCCSSIVLILAILHYLLSRRNNTNIEKGYKYSTLLSVIVAITKIVLTWTHYKVNKIRKIYMMKISVFVGSFACLSVYKTCTFVRLPVRIRITCISTFESLQHPIKSQAIKQNMKPTWERVCEGTWVRSCVGSWVRSYVGTLMRGHVCASVRCYVWAWVREYMPSIPHARFGALVLGCALAWVRWCVSMWLRECVGSWVRECVCAWVHGFVGASPRGCLGT